MLHLLDAEIQAVGYTHRTLVGKALLLLCTGAVFTRDELGSRQKSMCRDGVFPIPSPALLAPAGQVLCHLVSVKQALTFLVVSPKLV